MKPRSGLLSLNQSLCRASNLTSDNPKASTGPIGSAGVETSKKVKEDCGAMIHAHMCKVH